MPVDRVAPIRFLHAAYGGAAVTRRVSTSSSAAYREPVAAIAIDQCDRATSPSFVDAHAPHGPCVLPCSPASTSTRANVTHAVGLRPSAFVEDSHGQEHRRP